MRERLKGNLSDKVIHYLFEPSIQEERGRSFEVMMYVNRAHLSMLCSEGIINREDGKEIMSALEAISSRGADQLEIDSNLEDLYFNIERELINEVGVEVGGQLHTGRSRNDLYATVLRINVRNKILDICKQIVVLRDHLLKIAEEGTDVVLTGYTHMQPAEPITLGHYMSAILHALKRDFDRFIHAYETTNHSPLGSGAMASTTFPINRRETAQVLGFIDMLGNSLDGVASRDYMLEALSAMNIFMNNLSRLSYDLYVWSTSEFNIVEVSNAVAASSSIMPQKKNPITLEHIKAKSSHILGAIVSTTSCLKNTPYGHSRDVAGEAQKGIWDSMDEVEATTHLMTETIKGLTFNEEEMYINAMHNFSTVTELANTLVREVNISFREAHQLVGNLVNEMISSNIMVTEITPDLINKVSKKVLKKEVTISSESIKRAIEPQENVSEKVTLGGPAPREVNRQLELLKSRLEQDKQWIQQQCHSLDRVEEVLREIEV